MTSTPRFELRPWRKPPLADGGAVVGFGAPAAILGLTVALVGPGVLRAPEVLVWAGTAGALAVIVGAAWVLGHPRYDAGGLWFADGRLHLDCGRRHVVTVPVSAIRSALIVRHAQPERDTLVLHVEGRMLGLSIPLVRLQDPVDQVLGALRAEVSRHGDLAAFDGGSARQAGALQWVLAASGAVGMLVALWKLLAG